MLILVAHGSHDPRWRASLERMLRPLEAESDGEAVRLAFMELSEPSLEQVVLSAASGGYKTVRVLPLFLAYAGHVERDIKPAVQRLRIVHPDLDLTLLKPVGQHEAFVEMIRTVAKNTREGAGAAITSWRAAVH